MDFCINSPLGPLLLEETDGALTRVQLVPGLPLSEAAPCPLLAEAERQLSEYFAGKQKYFTLPMRVQGTEFQRRVWSAMAAIPYGKTATYGQLAAAIGNPKASRAVGSACHSNPLWILLPCHRVVGAGGSLTGYAGGLEAKQFLLQLEQKQ